MLYVMRIQLPDTPGSLGSVATALSHVPADIVSLRVIEREARHAVDEICLEAQGVLPDVLRSTVQAIPGVVAEIVRRIDRVPDPSAALALSDRLGRHEGPPTVTLVEGLPDALTAAWAIAVEATDDLRVLAASPGAPSPGVMDTPWLPLTGARRLEVSDWTPVRWRMSRSELAAAPLGSAARFVIVGRWAGMRFRSSELRQLELLAGMAVRADAAEALSPV